MSFHTFVFVSLLSLFSSNFHQNMSDKEHHVESSDTGASYIYQEQASNIRYGGFIVIKGRPCRVVEVSTSRFGKHGQPKRHFVGIDIFTFKKLEMFVPPSDNCDVPYVNITYYRLINISEDGFVSLITEDGISKDDLKLPTDETLLEKLKNGFAEGKHIIVSVQSAMGEEQMISVKELGISFI